MSIRVIATLPLLIALVAASCGAAATAAPTPSSTAPAPSPTATSAAVATPTATAIVTPSARSLPAGPTPIVLRVSGHVTMASDGRAVPGVRIRFLPASMNGGCPIACPRDPGPNVVVTSDANGAYDTTVPAWTLEALADSDSSQLSLFVTPPSGMKIVGVTQAETVAVGPFAPNMPEWYFRLQRYLNGPIDITLSPE